MGGDLYGLAFLRRLYEDGEYHFLFFYGDKLWIVDMVSCAVVEEKNIKYSGSLL